jgi:Tfp pilus assembly pilus retraction ATPase PilT
MIETGRAVGMQTMDSAIGGLVAGGHITPEEAIASAHDPEKMRRILAA